jgi:hypothetical protein
VELAGESGKPSWSATDTMPPERTPVQYTTRADSALRALLLDGVHAGNRRFDSETSVVKLGCKTVSTAPRADFIDLLGNRANRTVKLLGGQLEAGSAPPR